MPFSSVGRRLFGAEVRRRRIAAHWSIEHLAASASISANYLGAMASGLWIPVGELLGGGVKALTAAAVEMARAFDTAAPRVGDGFLEILRHVARDQDRGAGRRRP